MRQLTKLAMSAALLFTVLLALAAGVRAEPQVLKIKLEVNGRAVHDPKFEIVIYAGQKTFVPTLVDDGFVVPAEVYNYAVVSIQFNFKGHKLFFRGVESFHFESDDWTVGVWNKVPYDPEVVLPETRRGRKLKAVQYIKTNPKDRLGVIIAEKFYEKKR
jgi:hypothetical protein